MKYFIFLLGVLNSYTSCSQSNAGAPLKYDITLYKIYDSVAIDRSGYFKKLYINISNNRMGMEEFFGDSLRKYIAIRLFTLNGKYDGPIYYFNNLYPQHSGKIFSTGEYRNGKRDGKWIDYRLQSDLIEREYYFKNDERTGTWKYYDEKGKVIKTERFKTGD